MPIHCWQKWLFEGFYIFTVDIFLFAVIIFLIAVTIFLSIVTIYLNAVGIFLREVRIYLIKVERFLNEVPTILLSTLSYQKDTIENAGNTKAFLEDARSIARIIKQDFSTIEEIQQGENNKSDRIRLQHQNPNIEISINTIKKNFEKYQIEYNLYSI